VSAANQPSATTQRRQTSRLRGGAVNSLMTELLEGHIRHHVLDPKRRPNSEQTHAADEVIDMVKTYLR
jgi:DNA-binding FrmR family transcriptional regulator